MNPKQRIVAVTSIVALVLLNTWGLVRFSALLDPVGLPAGSASVRVYEAASGSFPTVPVKKHVNEEVVDAATRVHVLVKRGFCTSVNSEPSLLTLLVLAVGLLAYWLLGSRRLRPES